MIPPPATAPFLSRLYGGIQLQTQHPSPLVFLSRLYGGILQQKLRTTAKILGFLHFSANHPNFSLAKSPLFYRLSHPCSKFGSKFWYCGEIIQTIATKPHQYFLILHNTFYAKTIFLLIGFTVHLHKRYFFRHSFPWKQF